MIYHFIKDEDAIGGKLSREHPLKYSSHASYVRRSRILVCKDNIYGYITYLDD